MRISRTFYVCVLSFALACGGGSGGGGGSDDGVDATDGGDGTDSTDGTDGADGKDGTDGTDKGDGTDGKDGEDSTDGTDGGDATDGIDGTDSTEQTPQECIKEKCKGVPEALVCDPTAVPPAAYSNNCEALCWGAKEGNLEPGSCQQASCEEAQDCAGQAKDAWCHKNALKEYVNKCYAQCAGIPDAELGKGTCKSLCPEINGCEQKPVELYCHVTKDAEGNEVQSPYANLCFAECNGLTKDDLQQGKCADVDLPCELELECAKAEVFFVCDDLNQETYQNDCYACCAIQEANPDLLEGQCYEDLSPGVCTNDCPNLEACTDETDYPKDGTKKVCDPVTNTTYDNTFWACCNSKDWLAAPPQVVPGECEDDCDPQKEDCGCQLNCPPVNSPVCAIKGDKFVQHVNSCKYQEAITFGDACDQLEDGWSTCSTPCGDFDKCINCEIATACKPVCGNDGVSYFNSCFMTCAGVDAEHDGPCCNCDPPTPETLVCSKDGNTWANDCELTCMGEPFHYKGACVPGCNPDPANDPIDGVCGTKNGELTKFVNMSCALGAGATCAYEGTCQFGTNECQKTNKEYSPVCATYLDQVGEPQTKTFPNPCHAGCQLPESQVSGLCQFCTDQCAAADPKDYCDPATCITYPNLCVPKKCLEIPVEDLDKDACPADCGVVEEEG